MASDNTQEEEDFTRNRVDEENTTSGESGKQNTTSGESGSPNKKSSTHKSRDEDSSDIEALRHNIMIENETLTTETNVANTLSRALVDLNHTYSELLSSLGKLTSELTSCESQFLSANETLSQVESRLQRCTQEKSSAETVKLDADKAHAIFPTSTEDGSMYLLNATATESSNLLVKAKEAVDKLDYTIKITTRIRIEHSQERGKLKRERFKIKHTPLHEFSGYSSFQLQIAAKEEAKRNVQLKIDSWTRQIELDNQTIARYESEITAYNIPDKTRNNITANTALQDAFTEYWIVKEGDTSGWANATKTFNIKSDDLSKATLDMGNAKSILTNATQKLELVTAEKTKCETNCTHLNTTITAATEETRAAWSQVIETDKRLQKDITQMTNLCARFYTKFASRHPRDPMPTLNQRLKHHVMSGRESWLVKEFEMRMSLIVNQTVTNYLPHFMPNSTIHPFRIFNNTMPPIQVDKVIYNNNIVTAQAVVIACGTALFVTSHHYRFIKAVGFFFNLTFLFFGWDSLLQVENAYLLSAFVYLSNIIMLQSSTRQMMSWVNNPNTSLGRKFTSAVLVCCMLIALLCWVYWINPNIQNMYLEEDVSARAFSGILPLVQTTSVVYGVGSTFIPKVCALYSSCWLKLKDNWAKKTPFGVTKEYLWQVIYIFINAVIAFILMNGGLANRLVALGVSNTAASADGTPSVLGILQANQLIGEHDDLGTIKGFVASFTNFIGAETIQLMSDMFFFTNDTTSSLFASAIVAFKGRQMLFDLVPSHVTSVLFSIKAAPPIIWNCARDRLECVYDTYAALAPLSATGSPNWTYKPPNPTTDKWKTNIMKMFIACKTPYCFMPGDLLECRDDKKSKRILQIFSKFSPDTTAIGSGKDKQWADYGMHLVLGDEDGTTSSWRDGTTNIEQYETTNHLPVREAETKWIPKSESDRLTEWLISPAALIHTADTIFDRSRSKSREHKFCPYSLRFKFTHFKTQNLNRYACVLFTFQPITEHFKSKVVYALMNKKSNMCVYNVCIGEHDSPGKSEFMGNLGKDLGVCLNKMEDLCVSYGDSKLAVRYTTYKVFSPPLIR